MIGTVVSVGLPVEESMNIKKNRFSKANLSGNEKRLCVVTGIHGDELEGQYICYSVIKKITEHPECLKGIIDIYPCLNPLGMETITRRVPTFDIDMNRTFPGNEEGDMLEYSAAKIIKDIAGADFCVDIHASNIFLREIPQVRISVKDKEKLIEHAVLLNTEFIWVHDSPTVNEASLYNSLMAKGVPTLSVEMGAGMRITKEYGDEITEGIFCLLENLGIWEGEVIIPKKPIISDESNRVSLIHAEEPGIFLPNVEHWHDIHKDEVVGEIVCSLTGLVKSRVVAPCDGVIFTLREYPVVYAGSLIARILEKF